MGSFSRSSCKVSDVIVINTPWYTGNREIHKDVKLPLFDNHIKALAEGYNSQLSGTRKSTILATWKAFVPTQS
jgi:hypothetical protein